MDKETLSNYGWIVICVLVLAVMIALATPFGSFVSDAVKSTTQGLFDVNQSALNSTGLINIGDQSFGEGGNGNGGAGNQNIALRHDGEIIPQNATYKSSQGTSGFSDDIYFYDGDKFPEVMAGDYYSYGDYKYSYYLNDSSYGTGWAVSLNTAVTDKNQTTYGEILSSINGAPVTIMNGTFQGCYQLTVSPNIPDSVEYMFRTFRDCNNLTTAPKLPSSLKSLSEGFFGCKKLAVAPELPKGVENINNAFNCCFALTTAPAIPNSVVYMNKAFYQCENISIAPEIPSSVQQMDSTFQYCSSLEGSIIINATPEHYTNCLKSTKITEVIGSCSESVKKAILSTRYN